MSKAQKKEQDWMYSLLTGKSRLVAEDGTELVLMVTNLRGTLEVPSYNVSTMGGGEAYMNGLPVQRVELSAVMVETGRVVVPEPLPEEVVTAVARAISLTNL